MIPTYQAARKFHERFQADLMSTLRWHAFAFVYDELARLNRPVQIVETGCARLVGNWSGDGQSTLVWSWIADQLGGSVTSYDITPESCRVARQLAPTANIIQSDSVAGLAAYPTPEEIDFLYLDSMDYDGDPSAEHHLAELGAVWDKLRPGAIIAVDDNRGGGDGKHKFILRRLSSSGIEPLIHGYVVSWIKPTYAPTWEELTENETNHR
jgi:hypothetical protein